jgi:hypothetical protein
LGDRLKEWLLGLHDFLDGGSELEIDVDVLAGVFEDSLEILWNFWVRFDWNSHSLSDIKSRIVAGPESWDGVHHNFCWLGSEESSDSSSQLLGMGCSFSWGGLEVSLNERISTIIIVKCNELLFLNGVCGVLVLLSKLIGHFDSMLSSKVQSGGNDSLWVLWGIESN